MTRYFLDLINGHGKTVDEEGQVFATDLDASREALRVLAEIAMDEQIESDHLSLTVMVRDPKGRVFYEGRLSIAGQWLSDQDEQL